MGEMIIAYCGWECGLKYQAKQSMDELVGPWQPFRVFRFISEITNLSRPELRFCKEYIVPQVIMVSAINTPTRWTSRKFRELAVKARMDDPPKAT